jgi:hypothetical protein
MKSVNVLTATILVAIASVSIEILGRVHKLYVRVIVGS